MSASDAIGICGLTEPFASELADRLEHPVPLAHKPQQALLDKRLQRVEIGIAH
jgi:hypothetical protein